MTLQHGCRHRHRHRHDLSQGRGPAGVAARRPVCGAADSVATSSRGQTEIDPYRLLDVAIELIGRAVRAAESAWGPVRVRRLGVAGLAESGVLLDAAGRPAAPVIAWFDHRGGHEMRAGRPGIPGICRRVRAHHRSSVVEPGQHRQAAVAARQRVPARPRIDLAERARMDRLRPGRRSGSRAVAGLPDRSHRSGHRRGVARCRGGGRAVGPDPSRRTAGRRPRRLPGHDGVVSCAAGAVLTVAGHDHPVAAIGAGAVEADELFDSSGTADVLARCIPGRWRRPSARTS